MKTVVIILLITCGFALLLTVSIPKPKKKKLVRKKAKPRLPDPRVPTKKTVVPPGHESVAMSPQNPRWAKIYVEEMAKRRPEETTAVIKKWLREK